MAEDRDLFKDIETVGAIAIGAGIGLSALMSRRNDILSDGLNRVYSALNKAFNESSRRLGDYNITAVKRVFNNFSRAAQEYTGAEIYNTFKPGGITDILSNLQNVRNSARRAVVTDLMGNVASALQRMYGGTQEKDRIINELVKNYTRDFRPTKNVEEKLRLARELSEKFRRYNKGVFDPEEYGNIVGEVQHAVSYLFNESTDSLYRGSLNVFDGLTRKRINQRIDTLAESIRNVLSDVTTAERAIGSTRVSQRGDAFFDALLGNQRATVKEVINAYEQSGTRNTLMDQYVATLRELISGDQNWENVYWDGMRISRDGKLESYKTIEELTNKLGRGFGNTIVGRILHVNDIYNVRRNALTFMGAGDFNPVLAKLAEGTDDSIIQNSYYKIGERIFKVTAEGLEHLSDLDNQLYAIGPEGAEANALRKMFGSSSYIDRNTGLLDLNKSPLQNPVEKVIASIDKFWDTRYGRTARDIILNENIYKSINNIDNPLSPEQLNEIYNMFANFSETLGYISKPLSQSTASRLRQTAQTPGMADYLSYLTLDDSDLLNSLLGITDNLDENPVLRDIVRKVQRNPALFDRQKLDIRKSLTYGFFSKFDDYDQIRSYIEDNLQGAERRNALTSAIWASFEKALYSPSESRNIFRSEASGILNVGDLLYNNIGAEQARDDLRRAINDNISLLQKGFNDKVYVPEESSSAILVNKLNPLEIITGVNEEQKARAFKKMYGQFYAGQGSAENFTTISYGAYTFINRLIEPFESIGLGFSSKSASNIANYYASVFLKRIVPIAGAIYGLSYLNDEARNLTGTSLVEAGASGIANIDLAFRRTVDILGLTRKLKEYTLVNPIGQYLSGDQEYQSYDERLEWYRTGYTPVRKGRFWSFGSTSEFRGGAISYFKPNYLRMASSNYYDISLYGSSNEKWRHSLIPTPRYPFSPITFLLDPYWLEKRHKEDRPYPLSGNLFDQNTPWGVILNPTVGQLIKPQVRMHQDVLQGTNIDVRTLIAQRNEEIYRRAELKNSYAVVDENGAKILSSGGYGYDTEESTGSGTGGTATGYGAGYGGGGGIGAGVPVGYGEGVPGAPGTASGSLNNIEQINNAIIERAKKKSIGAYKAGSFGTAADIDPRDFIDPRSTEEFVNNLAYSFKELGGIYGFALNTISPPNQRYALAQAGTMTAFTRRFWEQNLGGLGGGVMEIARRFFPHEDRSVEYINNIQNTMPDWMPSRFRLGDPFTKLPLGEARLPGPGYESLNELHPDQFGLYGSFDRMKILADIAPWSDEYKTWRQIAFQTVQDPYLRKQLDEIVDRTRRQSSKHTFYNYRFTNVDYEDVSGTIASVEDSYFTLYGSNKKYTLAGINVQNRLDEMIAAGAEVNLKIMASSARQKTISAIMYDSDGNVNKRLLEAGRVKRKEDLTSPIDAAAMSSRAANLSNSISEFVAHAPIPFIHDKFLRVNSPLESWADEEVYGTPYSTWEHPIEGYIKPALDKTRAAGPLGTIIAATAFGASKYLDSLDINPAIKGAAKVLEGFSSHTAFAGSVIGGIFNLGSKKNLKAMSIGTDIGAAIGLGLMAYEQSDNPIVSTLSGAAIGATLGARFFETSSSKGAKVGALIGLGISALQNPSFNLKEMFGKYIPEDTEKRWELQEYFDRLRYIKYMGLYEHSARMAELKEGVNIRSIVESAEFQKEKNEEIRSNLLIQYGKISNNYLMGNVLPMGDVFRRFLTNNIAERLEEIEEQEEQQLIVPAGEYVRSALAYREAAKSTIYALNEDSSWAQILRALPTTQRDYFLAFSKETDPEKRKKIRELVPGYEQKVLDIIWGEKVRETESNFSYFMSHELPGPVWSGWSPKVNLDNVAIKTIKNEGMLISDFGYYDSQARTPTAQATPIIRDFDNGQSGITTQVNLVSAMHGLGLFGVNVSVISSTNPITRVYTDITRIAPYEVKSKLNSVLGQIFY